jgi:hypothetical protein
MLQMEATRGGLATFDGGMATLEGRIDIRHGQD